MSRQKILFTIKRPLTWRASIHLLELPFKVSEIFLIINKLKLLARFRRDISTPQANKGFLPGILYPGLSSPP